MKARGKPSQITIRQSFNDIERLGSRQSEILERIKSKILTLSSDQESEQLERDLTKGLYQASAMVVKLVTSIWRKEGMTPEEFSIYWKEVHGPMFLDRIPCARQYISRYEQVHLCYPCFAQHTFGDLRIASMT